MSIQKNTQPLLNIVSPNSFNDKLLFFLLNYKLIMEPSPTPISQPISIVWLPVGIYPCQFLTSSKNSMMEKTSQQKATK